MRVIRKYTCFFFLILVATFFDSCDSFEDDPYEVNEAIDPDEADNNDMLDPYEIRRMANALDAGENLKSNLAQWGYETGFEWVSGAEHETTEGLKIKIVKSDDKIRIRVKTDVSSFEPYPIVYNSDFHENEDADYLKLNLVISNNKNRKRITYDDRDNLNSEGEASYSFDITTNELKDIEEGLAEFTVSIETELVTFFGKRSKVKPVSAKIKLDYFVPKIYRTDIYFNGLVLNEEETKKKLGDNDWNNGTPEAGILVKYNDQSVLYEYVKNSFNYIPNRPMSRPLYHLSPSDTVKVYALDVDYGFNGNDVINDTLIPLKKLEGTDFYNWKMKCVDNLLLYSKFKGSVN